MNFSSLWKRQGTTLAGIFSLALCSLVLLCGASSVPIENLLPQGALQGDLNAGGHNLTNAATVSATNVVVSGSFTAPTSFTLPYAKLSGTPTLGPLASVSPGGTPAPTTFLKYDGTNFFYATPPALTTSGTTLLYGNGSGGIANATVGGGLAFSSGTLSANLLSVAGRTGAVTLSAADISGLAASATTDTTSASNITSGTLAAARVATLNQNTTGSAASFTGALAGDVTGSQGTTTVSRINGTTVPAANSTALGNALNSAKGLVTQDANFTINANQIGLPTGPVVNCLCVGDSLTYGYGSTGTYLFTSSANFSYPANLASSPLFYNGTVWNAGYPGATVSALATYYDPGVVQTTITTTAGSTSATVTGSTTGLVSFMLITSPNTVNPSTNSIGIGCTISGTAVNLGAAATVTGSCTATFSPSGGYPSVTDLTYPTPLRNASITTGCWSPRQLQPAYFGVPTYSVLWAGATDLGVNMVAGYATSSGSVITFGTATLTSACTWTSSSNVITVAAGTSLANVVPGMTVGTTIGMSSAIYVSQVDYSANKIYLASNPSGSGTSATLTFSTVTSSATGYNAFYSGSNSDAQLTGTVSTNGTNTATMSSAPGISGTQLIVLVPQQTAYRTAFQNLVTKMISDNPANGVVIVTHPRYCGIGSVTAPLTQALCNGNSNLWDAWLRTTYGGSTVTGAYLYDLAARTPFASYNATYWSQDGTHYTAPAYQFIAQDITGFFQATYAPVFSGRTLYPLNGKAAVTRNQVDALTAYLDTANTWLLPQIFPSLSTGPTVVTGSMATNIPGLRISGGDSFGNFLILENPSVTAGARSWGIRPDSSGTLVICALNDGSSYYPSSNAITIPRSSTSVVSVNIAVPLILKSYTVATLPTGVAGATAYVTDAISPTYNGALTGGGTVVTKVFYNGAAWVSQ